jgi:hypothetical protein
VRGFEPAVWPQWHFRRPSKDEGRTLKANLDLILASAARPDIVIETNSMLETVFAARQLSGPYIEVLTDHFDGYPHLENYEYWHLSLELIR